MSHAVGQRRFLVAENEFQRWFEQVLSARGFDATEAQLATTFATTAALYAVETHGARKLLHLLGDEFRRSQSCHPAVEHEVIVNADALEVWDAHLKLGPAVAHLAQQRAHELASRAGVGIVCVRNTNHYGWGGAYALQFMQDGFLSGNICQGAIPIVTPIGGNEPRMGCNAVSIALESHSPDCPFFLWDAGIGAVSWGEVQRSLLDGSPLPTGCVVDKHGQKTTHADEAASLLPAGSIGNTLGMLIELLAAQIGAGDPRFRSAPPNDTPAGEPVTCSFVHFCLNLNLFNALAFPHARSRAENVAAMAEALLYGNGSARLSGMRKWQARQRAEEAGGLLFSTESMDAFRHETESQGVPFMSDVREVQVHITELHVARK